MSAREQARKAAHDFVVNKYGRGDEWLDHQVADAASDVWEPIVREALETLLLHENLPVGHVWYPRPTIRRLKEALGE